MIKVMIVEDEPPIARSLKRMMESEHSSYQVVACAINGQEALEWLQREQIDVVFTDIRMPVMDGIELLSRLSLHDPQILKVVISGYQEFEYARKAIQYQVFDYMLKPIVKPVLAELLHKIADQIQVKEADLKRQQLYEQLSQTMLPGEQTSETQALEAQTLEAKTSESQPLPVVLEVERFLQKHYTENITNEMLSQKFGFVSSYISKLFRAHKGVSPSQYVTKLRIDKAKEIIRLQPHLRMKEVAELVGYNDALYFSRVFRKETGDWPTQF
ncbi:response regulator transcription factor [Paenibacillus eucommiae]|uniref:YesN/AraC family two-component response regulator n=1 Tax=Paenibacillus eucommiae TaxID=1355755 RepID=A0ABS4J3X5_9BACL|nr:response regulator [Paenibacillus eucommiae]MBP1994518.1 YesN/AraC family two-component response regulator [Paenibacillus eucommiae]